MTATKVDYPRYLASREWRLKRKDVIDANDNLCYRCLSAPIQDVHHVTYERLGHEEPDDLIGLCRPCHEYVSAERDDDPALAIILPLLEKGLHRPVIQPDGTIYFWATHDLPNGRFWIVGFENTPRLPSAYADGVEAVLAVGSGVCMHFIPS